MKPIAAFLRCTVLPAAACALLAPQARAESEYEYAKQLMTEVNSASFSTDDLVERLAARLDESPLPTSKMEAKLIRASLLRRQAAESPPEKRVEKLRQAGEFFKELVATNDKKFRLFDTVEKDSEAVQMEMNRAKLDMAKDNPAEAKKLRAEIGAVYAKKAAGFKETADKTKPEFEAALKRFNTEKERLDPKGEHPEKMPGKEFLEPLDRLFFAWIVADQKYVAVKVEEIEVLDETDANRKKIGEEVVAHCAKQLENEVLADWAAITARYSYFQGRIHAALGNEDAASKSWNDVLEVELGPLPDYAKKQVIAIDKMIIGDLVRMKMKSKKYNEVEDVVIKIRSGTLRDIFNEDIGKQLLVEYAKALTIPAETAGDYEKAVKELRAAIAREKQPNSIWANSFARAMAEILVDARKKKLYPHLSAREWFDAAHGMHLVGRYIYTQEYEKLAKSADPKDKEQAKVKFEEAYKEFANAVDYYRRAITEARRPDHTDLATRLDIEPKAWFEMGLSYLRMKHDYEAIIAYKAMRDAFLPDTRAKWLPDKKTNAKLYTREVNAALSTLDLPKEREGMVAKSGVNILIALQNNENAHKDPWNIVLRAKIMDAQKSPLDPDSITDKDYIVADGDAKAARAFAESAKQEQKAKVAHDNWNQAKLKYISAAEKFAKVPASSPVYDFALVQYANCMTQAQAIIAEGRMPTDDPKEREAQAAESKDLAKKALAGYDKYEDYVAKNVTQDEKVLGRRKSVKGLIILAKNSLYVGAGLWEEANKTSDEYIAYETENPPPGGKSSISIALINKFRALLAMAAGAKDADAKRDELLKQGVATLGELRKLGASNSDAKTHAYMLKMLSDRYNIAAYQLDKKRKSGSLSKEDMEKLDDQITDYENKVAELEFERMDLIEDAAQNMGLDEYSRLVYLLNRAGQQRRAADTAAKLLKKFDPQNKNQRIPENEQKWNKFLAEMLGVISYSSINKSDRCIAEHKVLVDYMFDTDKGAQIQDGSPQRPPNDMYNQNMEKALAKLESIRKPDGEFKDVQTIKAGPRPDSETFKALTEAGADPAGKSWLQILEEEIQYRRKVLAARDLLAELSLVVAKQLKANPAESQEYMKIAKDQIEILKEQKGENTAIEVKVAEIDIALGKNEEAMLRLFNVAAALDPSSERYFYVKRLISEMFAEQKKWKEAAEFPEFVAVTQGFNSEIVKKRWPEMKAFLKTCYDNGVTMPPALKKKFEAVEPPHIMGNPNKPPAETAPKTEPKTEPKADEPKADAAKPAEEKK